MKKVKVGIWAAIVLFFAILIYQNQSFFLQKTSLGLDLIVVDYKTPEVMIVFVCFAFMIAGFLLGEYFDLIHQFKNKKKVKALQAEIGSQNAAVPAGASEPVPAPAGPTPDEGDKTVVLKPEEKPAIEEQEK